MAYGAPELADAAWSGWAEWARQWLLLNRRMRFDPDSDGEHKLWFAVGGSAGHSGLWGLDIVEGRRTDPGGRRWDVAILPAGKVRAEAKTEKETQKDEQREAKFKADCGLAVRKLEAKPDGLTTRTLRDRCKFSGERIGRVVEQLRADGRIEPCKVTSGVGKRKYPGFKLREDDEPDTLL